MTPFGEILALPGRGLLMGNRGILHDAQRTIVRDSQVRRWIACRLEFRGRQRRIMTPGSYTELFFLDEAAAFAAGHRPCAECRRADFLDFQAAWRRIYPRSPATAAAIDTRLHAERRHGPWLKRTHHAALHSLPRGSYISLDDQAWLVLNNVLRAWSADSYRDLRPKDPAGEVTVLTPPSLVAVLAVGYRAALHPSAAG
ncbi:MAG: hypothetical protein LC797_07895 [Chloroflexi bacterium]|nr:hypothetical protein [Chloroflexota bacterium]